MAGSDRDRFVEPNAIKRDGDGLEKEGEREKKIEYRKGGDHPLRPECEECLSS